MRLILIFCLFGFFLAETAQADQQLSTTDFDAFIMAVKKGDLRKVKEFAQQAELIKQQDAQGKTALIFAISRSEYSDKKRKAELIKILINHGSDINVQDKYGGTPLSFAALEQHAEFVELLLQEGADTSTVETGLYPLIMAVDVAHLESVRLLLTHNQELARKKRPDGLTALHGTADYESRGSAAVHAQIAELLIQNGADVNALWMYQSEKLAPLQLAAVSGRAAVAQTLLDAGADPLWQDENGNTALMRAVMTGNIKIVSVLADKTEALDVKNAAGWTPLMVASGLHGSTTDRSQQKKIVRLLLKKGAQVDSYNSDGNTALHLAVIDGAPEVVALLLSAGANAGHKNTMGLTAEQLASNAKEWWALSALRRHAGKPEFQQKLHTEALQAVKERDAKKLEKLLEADNFYWYTEPLLSAEAVAHDCLACLKVMQQVEFDFKQVNAEGWSGLMIAVKEGRPDMVRLLLDSPHAGQQVNLLTGESALQLTAYEETKGSDQERADIARLLLEYGADVNHISFSTASASALAALYNWTELTKVLLKANPSTDQLGRASALMVAAAAGHFEIVKLWSEKQDMLHAKDHHGRTALHYATFEIVKDRVAQERLVRYLLEAGIDVNVRSKGGNTALHNVVESNDYLIVKTLLKYGADPAIKNQRNQTTEELAREVGNAEVLDLFKSE